MITFDFKNTSEFAGWLEGKSAGEYNVGIKASAETNNDFILEAFSLWQK